MRSLYAVPINLELYLAAAARLVAKHMTARDACLLVVLVLDHHLRSYLNKSVSQPLLECSLKLHEDL